MTTRVSLGGSVLAGVGALIKPRAAQDRGPAPPVRTVAGKALSLLTDVVLLMGVVAAVPFVILLVGLPLVLVVRLLLELAQRLG